MLKYVVIGGVNGAGKSTLYISEPNMWKLPRINTDEIVREFGDWQNVSDVMKAGKIAVKLIDKYFSEDEKCREE